MKAIIMAGGDGSRLRPLTCTLPKPMVRILDVPAMEYAIRLLHRHDIRQIAVTLKYLPDVIRDYFGDGSRFGVSITYFTETTALGTAGGVKQAQDFLNEPFVVLSGDGITDCDLTSAIRFHRNAKAQATLVTVRADDPREYGLVCADATGRITRFCEKPDWSDVVCDRINTGIYVLEPAVLDEIPARTFCDFSKNVFPTLLAKGRPLFAWDAKCYWCDIGDTAALIRANHDALHGKISLIPVPEDGLIRHPSARIDENARIEPPAYIGANAHIAAGAIIGPDTVVGSDSHIAPGAVIRRSVLSPGAHIAEDAQLRHCLTAENVRIQPDAQLYENAVAGANCVIGRGAELASGVRIWPDKAIPDRMRLRDNIIWGNAAQAVFHTGAVDCFTPAQAALCAQALCAAIKPRIVLIAHNSSPVAAAQHQATCAGLMAQGAQVYDCHCATLMELRSTIRHIGADCACYVTNDSFYPLNSHGVSLSGNARRQFLSCINRGDCPAPYAGITRLPQSAGRSDLIYLRAVVTDELIRSLSGFSAPVAIYARHEQLLSLAERAFLRAGLTVRAEWEEEMMELSPDEIGVWLSDTGESVRFFTSEGEMTEAETQLLIAQTLLEMDEKRLILPDDSTPAIEPLAERYRAHTERVPGSPSRWAEHMAFIAPDQLPMHFDGITASLNILSMLNRLHMSLSDFRRSVPACVRRRRVIDIPESARAHTLERLNQMLQPASPGHFHMTDRDAHAWILPSDEDSRCTVLTEAADLEVARELCDFYERIVRDAAQLPE